MRIHKFVSILIILHLVLLTPSIYAPQTLQITVTTDKQSYDLGENVQVHGNLTLDGVPVQDGLVAIQIDTARGDPIVIRTLPTGTLPPQDWKIELLEIVPCDSEGNPKSSFQRGATAYFKPTIRSTDSIARTVAISLNLYYAPSMLPFRALFPLTGYTIYPGETKSSILAVPIQSTAATGGAMVYASVFTTRPKDGGTAYSSEKSAPFTITSSSAATATYATETVNPASTEGNLNLTFKLPSTNGILGQYTAYANAMYKGEDAFPLIDRTNHSFQVILTGDIYVDGIVDFRDLNIIARAYGSVPGDQKWDERADLIKDNVIDYRDMNLCARNYGKSGTY
jgi:hypothetical protein